MTNIAELGIRTEPLIRADTCAQHGEFSAKNYIGNQWTSCPACAGEKKERERIEQEVKDKADRLERWRRSIRGAGIPERFADRTLETYVADSDGKRRALEFAAAYAADFDAVLRTGRSAVFCGKPGTGKTHLAVGIGLQVMRSQSRTVLFSTVIRAVRRVKETWSKGSDETETDAIEAMVTPDLLILDEIGVQFGSETEKLILFDVLNERYERRKPTVLITNLGMTDVKAYLGERVYDRLCEDGGEVVVFDWESHRRRSP